MGSVAKFGWPALVLGLALAFAAYFLEGYWRDLLISVSSVLLGFAIAIFIVNGFVSRDERRSAARTLLTLVQTDIVSFHNLFIESGHQEFGIPIWSSIITVMNENNKNPKALGTEDRKKVIGLIKKNQSNILTLLDNLESKLQEMVFILGWNFHPKITRDCMTSRLYISELKNLINAPQKSNEENLRLIERYFDVDADTSAVIQELARMVGHDLQATS